MIDEVSDVLPRIASTRSRPSTARSALGKRREGEVQAKQLAGDAVSVGGHQVEDLRPGFSGRGGGAADDAGVGIQRQARGQHAIGGNGKIVDRVTAGVGGTAAGAQSELPIGAVGGVHLAGQVHIDELGAIVADSEELGSIELDLHRFDPGAEGISVNLNTHCYPV